MTGTSIKRFRGDENGALLVFFGMCCAAIFLIAALSFDLGRRASTQTELQSFADNVALAAAGELNGFAGAMARAETAAGNLITDAFVFGTETDGDAGRTLAGSADYLIFFYETLPESDLTDLSSGACGTGGDELPLCTDIPANDMIARFARVVVKDVTVPWQFANLLSMFSSTALPAEEVNAEAVAGYTSLACDISPVFFCLPEGNAKDGATEETPAIWNPKNHIGEQILLRTGEQRDSFWESGNFGWLDPRDIDPYASLVDSGGDCAGLNGAPLLVCLIAAEHGVVNCYENGLLTTLPGQKQGIESAVFNTRFDMFSATVSQYESDSNFQPGPLSARGFTDSGGDTCLGNSVEDIPTRPLPNDDCFVTGDTSGGCQAWESVVRFGDGDWSQGRREYVEQNYSKDYNTYQTDPTLDPMITDDELIDIGGETYHVDDPFRPGNPDGNPVITNSDSRWQYYVAEVMTTYYDNPVAAYDEYMDDPDSPIGSAALKETLPTTAFPPMIEDVEGNNDPNDVSTYTDDITHQRAESGLPACATDPENGGPENFSLDPRRRTVVAAVVDCNTQEVNGKKDDVLATYFVEVFITEPVKEPPSDPGKFDMYVEIIGPALNVGDSTVTKGTFRNLVQLYR